MQGVLSICAILITHLFIMESSGPNALLLCIYCERLGLRCTDEAALAVINLSPSATA